ncbi:GNAT family N-acetyltransferase [Paenibacillus sp. RC67]|uniref:GNAT family N-acetyltransferase n=1 Tax=Paenibacillus sp. RC67 TaxID=3039392 RepID=UPI0024ACBEFE|nr:GNAT family N-acetyltransferase [Paenibacillus sp. RC67]
MDTVLLKLTNSTDPDLLQLITQLDEYLFGKYPAEEVFVVDFKDPAIHDVVFVTAYIDNVAVGCGAYRPLDEESAELKRIYVDNLYRKRGIASKILSWLEQEAQQAGYSTLRLETGPEQPESIALYEKCGFYHIEPFGEYVHCPSSICMEKKLGSSFPVTPTFKERIQ